MIVENIEDLTVDQVYNMITYNQLTLDQFDDWCCGYYSILNHN